MEKEENNSGKLRMESVITTLYRCEKVMQRN
jgi:hypothetical protein